VENSVDKYLSLNNNLNSKKKDKKFSALSTGQYHYQKFFKKKIKYIFISEALNVKYEV